MKQSNLTIRNLDSKNKYDPLTPNLIFKLVGDLPTLGNSAG